MHTCDRNVRTRLDRPCPSLCSTLACFNPSLLVKALKSLTELDVVPFRARGRQQRTLRGLEQLTLFVHRRDAEAGLQTVHR